MAVNLQPNVVYGVTDDTSVQVLPMPIQAVRNPTTLDRAPIGQVWINTVAATAFLLTKVENNTSTWVNQPGGTAVFNNLTVSPGPVALTSTLTTITGSANVAQLIYLHANGGVAETIDIHADQGTGVASVNVHSDVGGVTVAGGLATADAINITATNAAGGIDMDAGALISLNTTAAAGNIQIVAGINSAAGAAITLDTYTGVVTLTGLTTAAAATELITVTNALVSATSGVQVTAANLGANDAQMTVTRVVPGAGSFVVTLTNNGAQALNGNVILSFIVLS